MLESRGRCSVSYSDESTTVSAGATTAADVTANSDGSGLYDPDGMRL